MSTTTTTPRWLTDAEQRLWRAWLSSHAGLHLAIQRDLRDNSELSEPEFEVLVALTEGPAGGVRMSELAQQLMWDRSRLSHLVTRMCRRGLLERRGCPDDGRGAFVDVAAEGHRAIERAAPGHVETVRERFVDRLDEQDRADLCRILAKLQD